MVKFTSVTIRKMRFLETSVKFQNTYHLSGYSCDVPHWCCCSQDVWADWTFRRLSPTHGEMLMLHMFTDLNDNRCYLWKAMQWMLSRIMTLNLLSLYSLMFALFVKTHTTLKVNIKPAISRYHPPLFPRKQTYFKLCTISLKALHDFKMLNDSSLIGGWLFCCYPC